MKALCLVGPAGPALALASALTGRLAAQGLSVSVVVLDEDEREYDQPGKDSDRHRRAGAWLTALVGKHVYALNGDTPPGLDALLARLAPVDLVLVLGREPQPGLPWAAIGAYAPEGAVGCIASAPAAPGAPVVFADGEINRLCSLVIAATLQDKRGSK